MSSMDVSYRSWSSQEMIDWIISINSTFESKYKQVLTTMFEENCINGKNIDDLDREDLKTYGIINLNDRKQIYAEIQKLIVNKKRRDSLQLQATYKDDDINNDDDIKNDYDKLTNLTDDQWRKLKMDGYCMFDNSLDALKEGNILDTVKGYIRKQFGTKAIIQELIKIITNFYYTRYNPDLYVLLLLESIDDEDNKNEDDENEYYLVPKINIRLCPLLSSQTVNIIKIKKVGQDIMHHVLRYLNHHKGVRPQEIAKPIRSVKMERIVADKWDAQYINSFNKKTIFQVILAAKEVDCAPLLHLGCAKIATLIKGKSPEEIRNILADNGDDD